MSIRLSRRQATALLVVAAVLVAGIWAVARTSARRDSGTSVLAGRAAPVAPRGNDPVVAAAGDIVPSSATGHHQGTSDRVLAMDPTVVLALGDSGIPAGP